jgi:hypothetical protein
VFIPYLEAQHHGLGFTKQGAKYPFGAQALFGRQAFVNGKTIEILSHFVYNNAV